MEELIKRVPHDKPTEDHDREHDPQVCLRCRMEAEWKKSSEPINSRLETGLILFVGFCLGNIFQCFIRGGK